MLFQEKHLHSESIDHIILLAESMVYRVVLEKGEDFGYIAHCPALHRCHSQGESLDEAPENIKDAIRGCLNALDRELVTPPQKDVTFVEVTV